MNCKECSMFVPFPNNTQKGVCGEQLQMLIDYDKIVVVKEKTECFQVMVIPQESERKE